MVTYCAELTYCSEPGGDFLRQPSEVGREVQLIGGRTGKDTPTDMLTNREDPRVIKKWSFAMHLSRLARCY